MRGIGISIVCVLTILVTMPVNAHEFWMLAIPFSAPNATSTQVDLYVGQFFKGERIPLSAEYVTQFQRSTLAGTENLMRHVPRSGEAGIAIPLETPGTQILSIDTHPNFVKLSADQFNYYLADEGLVNIQQLLKNGLLPKVVNREKYRRHIKALIQVGSHADDTALSRTGQRLEIVPLAAPTGPDRSVKARFQVLFEGHPLSGILVKAWNKSESQTLLLRVVTDEDGVVMLTLPFSGVWMLSAVHMLPVLNDPTLDWESFWANLTFEIL